MNRIFSTKPLHLHKWKKVSSFISNDKKYGHDHNFCSICNTDLHIIRHWNKSPIIKFHKHQDEK